MASRTMTVWRPIRGLGKWERPWTRTPRTTGDMADPAQIPVISEPLFHTGNARVTLTPCMNGLLRAAIAAASVAAVGSLIRSMVKAVTR
jgi:hypothetical protein